MKAVTHTASSPNSDTLWGRGGRMCTITGVIMHLWPNEPITKPFHFPKTKRENRMPRNRQLPPKSGRERERWKLNIMALTAVIMAPFRSRQRDYYDGRDDCAVDRRMTLGAAERGGMNEVETEREEMSGRKTERKELADERMKGEGRMRRQRRRWGGGGGGGGGGVSSVMNSGGSGRAINQH